jgi:DNA-binding CsgD family transcriptional regulator
LQVLRTGTTDALAISDFLSVERFERTELYADYYRGIDATDQLSVSSKQPGFMLAFVVNRDQRSFNTRDRSMLELIRPHLEQAYRHLMQLELLRTGAAHGSQAMLAVSSTGRLQAIDERGARLLDEFTGVDLARVHRIEPLKSWLAGCQSASDPREERPRPEPPLILRDGWKRLEIRYVPGIETDQALLLLRAWTSKASPEQLQRFGLPPRHTEALSLLAQGLSDRQIAERLGVAHRTVTSMLREIYHRLGVANRTGAIALVFEDA